MKMNDDLIKETEEFAKNIMKDYDLSHDYNHIIRVKNMALKIAEKEKLDEQSKFEVILGALTHDIADHKYSSNINEQKELIKNLYDKKIDDKIIENISYIACNTSLSKEVANIDNIDNTNIKLKCVQDADRIDSLGSIGIFRYIIYGIIKNKSNIEDIIINIKNRSKLLMRFIKTPYGKKIAKKKYKIIKKFIKDYYKSMI